MSAAEARAQAGATPQAPPAATQDQQNSEDQTIVVMGLRETIQTSIAVERNQDAIVDALSSQEIGNIPALSVSEAIQTITGATTHREKGGASEIAIRGLGPFLSNATSNNRETTDGSGDRAVKADLTGCRPSALHGAGSRLIMRPDRRTRESDG